MGSVCWWSRLPIGHEAAEGEGGRGRRSAEDLGWRTREGRTAAGAGLSSQSRIRTNAVTVGDTSESESMGG